MDRPEFNLPSPLQEVKSTPINRSGAVLYIKRDDLIHPDVSGNKWRKLKYNFEKARLRGNRLIVTVGGAFSNHIAATAAAGQLYGFRTAAVVRGEEADLDNPTLGFARSCGMEIVRISRAEYRTEGSPDFSDMLKTRFGPHYYIPSGGANELGAAGCGELLSELGFTPHAVWTACGTGTTLCGLGTANAGRSDIYGVSVLKAGDFLQNRVDHHLSRTFGDAETEAHIREKIHILTDHHFGGYAKWTPELIDFMREFYRATGVKTDPIYTAKAAFAMYRFAERHPPKKGEKWVFIHTGGLQGLPPFEEKSGISVFDNC